MKTLTIRCHGGGPIGLGHVMRSIALAQACEERAKLAIRFFVNRGDGKAQTALRESGFEAGVLEEKVSEKEETETLLRSGENGRCPEFVWIDSYLVPPNVYKALRGAGARVGAVDDEGRNWDADILLNPNCGAEEIAYAPATGKTFLLGANYAMLRREYREAARSPRKPAPFAKRWLVSFGGGDPNDWTARALRGLQSIARPGGEPIHLRVVLGPSYRGEAKQIEQRWRSETIRMDCLTGEKSLLPLVADADLGIFAAGSSCYEAAFAGLPLLMVPTFRNQEQTAKGFVREGAAESASDSASISGEKIAKLALALAGDAARRTRMSAAGMNLVDGNGAERAAEALLS